MPLILAVEPDRRQAVNLTAVLRQRPRTELIVAGSAAAALEALGGRVPHVLLTSPLLSPQDDAALAAWMDGLGPASARVQALTIPILANGQRAAPKKLGVFARLRGKRPAATPDGCEPSAFAEHIGSYLKFEEAEEVEEVEEVTEVPEPVSLVPARPTFAARLRALRSPGDTLSMLHVPALAMPVRCVCRDLDHWRQQMLMRPLLQLPAPEEEPWVELPLDTLAEPARVLAAPPVFLETNEDVWVLRVEPGDAADFVPTVRVQRPARQSRAAKPAPKREPRPLQDEWGFFDPAQCGFSALIAKLDEIAEDEDDGETQPETVVRVVSY